MGQEVKAEANGTVGCFVSVGEKELGLTITPFGNDFLPFFPFFAGLLKKNLKHILVERFELEGANH